MPLRIVPYQQQTTPGMVGAPRAAPPALVDPTMGGLAAFAGEVKKIGEEMQVRQREADLYDRLGKAAAEVSNLELSFEHDQDFKTAPQRFDDGAKAISEKYLDGVSDSAVALAFKRQFGQLALAKSINVKKDAWKKEADYNVSSLDSSIDTYATAAANARNPAEASIVENQARLAISGMQANGWISAVDAGKRERTFLSKRDAAVVTRDLAIDPGLTASKLSLDPAYAPNIDPVTRERWVDQAYRRADTQERQNAADAERARKARGDEVYKEAISRQADGTLDRRYIEEIRAFIEPAEYKSLIAGQSGADRKDDPQAYAELQGLVYANPQEAERRAYVLHRNGLIKNETLASTLTKAREIGRQEGPRTEYERSRLFITDALKPSPLINDPAGSARYALAVREFDDFALGGNRKDEELRAKSEEIQKRFALVDMADLARKTSAGAQATPEAQLKSIQGQAEQLLVDRDAKKITPQEFNRKMSTLDRARRAAEKAQQNAGK